MKTIRLLLVIFMALLGLNSCHVEEDEAFIDTIENDTPSIEYHYDYTIGVGPFVYFEDVILKETLLNNFTVNPNKDNEISFEEALAFNGFIDVFNRDITTLVGIEKFENITGLNCARNQISGIDLSNNLRLEILNCGVNPISKISLSKNTSLKRLDIRTTRITELDLSKNVNLERIIGICNYYLKAINVQNGNNNNIGIFYLKSNNPVLECIQVDDLTIATSKANWTKPDAILYSLNCYDSNNSY